MAVVLAASCLLAAGDAPKPQKTPPAEAPGSTAPKGDASAQRIVYRPPALGRPRSRVGGGVRSARRVLPAPRALVPEHVGLTVSAHPPLFWFVDEAPPAESWQVFTLIDENRVTPIVEATIAAPDRPGIQRIDLAARDIELVPGVEYKWSVAIVEEPRRSPLDNVSFGWILRVEPPAGLEQDADAGAFAALGLWYDALAAASEEESGGEQPLRDALLEQVGLGFAVGAAAAGNSH